MNCNPHAITPNGQILDQQADNCVHVLIVQLSEDDDIINTVQEFRTEYMLDLGQNLVFNLFIASLVALISSLKAKFAMYIVVLDAGIRGHNQNRILKAYPSALRIRHMTVFQNLKQHIEYVRMSLLNLIK